MRERFSYARSVVANALGLYQEYVAFRIEQWNNDGHGESGEVVLLNLWLPAPPIIGLR